MVTLLRNYILDNNSNNFRFQIHLCETFRKMLKANIFFFIFVDVRKNSIEKIKNVQLY